MPKPTNTWKDAVVPLSSPTGNGRQKETEEYFRIPTKESVAAAAAAQDARHTRWLAGIADEDRQAAEYRAIPFDRRIAAMRAQERLHRDGSQLRKLGRDGRDGWLPEGVIARGPGDKLMDTTRQALGIGPENLLDVDPASAYVNREGLGDSQRQLSTSSAALGSPGMRSHPPAQASDLLPGPAPVQKPYMTDAELAQHQAEVRYAAEHRSVQRPAPTKPKASVEDILPADMKRKRKPTK